MLNLFTQKPQANFVSLLSFASMFVPLLSAATSPLVAGLRGSGIRAASTKSTKTFNLYEGQDYLAATKYIGQWVNIHLPPLLDEKFPHQLRAALKNLEVNHAFAAYAVVIGQGHHITLGSSFIVTNKSLVGDVLAHLESVLLYYQETYASTLDGAVLLRVKDLGLATGVASSVFHHTRDMKQRKTPAQVVSQVLDIPIPLVDFVDHIHNVSNWIDLKILHRNLSGWFMMSCDLVGLKGSFTIGRKDHEGNLIESITFNTTTGNGAYANFDANTSFRFRDTKLDNHTIRRSIAGREIFFDRNTSAVMNIEDRLVTKRRFHTAKLLQGDFVLDNTAFVTADIEGLIIDRKHNVPFLAEWFGVDDKGNEIGSVFKFQDFDKNHNKMLSAFWSDLMIKARGRTVYFHNWAGYDAYHALNALIMLADTMKGLTFKPLMHNGKLINLKVCQEVNGEIQTVLDIKDSIQILPGALGKLAKAFNVETLKEHSPHYFDPIKAGFPDCNYIGPVPAYKYFEPKRTSLEDWNAMVQEFGNNWNFMLHNLKYLHADVKSLFQILCAYFQDIGSEFKINAIKNCSVPGIAFKTWKGHQYPLVQKAGHKIMDLSQTYDSFLREAYLGGIVDVYIPHVKNAYYYDVNSLYPTAMCRTMPVGDPIFCVPSVDEFYYNGKDPLPWFGFLKATVKAPEGLKIGILSIRRDGKLITPAGVFTGTFFSEELRFALNNGYHLISIEYGYKFERDDNVFKGLIDRLNSMKIQAQLEGKPAKRNIAKLLMNSLYGRFGMWPHINRVEIMTQESATKIASAFPIIRSIEFGNGQCLLEWSPYPSTEGLSLGLITPQEVAAFSSEGTTFSETNVPIASAVTAYSRMIINGYKLDAMALGIDICYSDTDSLVTTKPLPADWIHSAELGKLKLEHIIKEAYFIAPKLYWLECYKGLSSPLPEASSLENVALYNVSKSRGYGETISRAEIETLYSGQPITVTKHKWYRSWDLHTVYFDMESKLTITGTFSKRSKVMSAIYPKIDHALLLPADAALASSMTTQDYNHYICTKYGFQPEIVWTGTKPFVLNDQPVTPTQVLTASKVARRPEVIAVDHHGSPYIVKSGAYLNDKAYRSFITIQRLLAIKLNKTSIKRRLMKVHT